MKRIISLLLCASLLLVALSSCTVLSSTSREKETVLLVGDYEVPYELYYYIFENLKADMPDANEETIEKEAFEMLREIYAVFELAKDFGIDPDGEYITSIADDAAKMAIEECGGKKEYKKALGESFMNDSVFRFMKKHSQTADEILSAIMNSDKYPKTDEEIIAVAKSDEFVCVKQILVMSENSVNTYDDTLFTPAENHTDEEALGIAKKALERARAGEDFDTLVSEYGESLYMFNNTDGYYVCRGMWEDVNEECIFGLEVGEISDVIESRSGYSVFLRCEKDDAFIESKVDNIAKDYYSAQYNLLIEERVAELEVKTTEAYDSINEEAE
ncbi:MAG: peptidylprolyl isomerase [Clostridia bacterium]|nr:peptidylprolyl isomerase [Clostridia bacterium]